MIWDATEEGLLQLLKGTDKRTHPIMYVHRSKASKDTRA